MNEEHKKYLIRHLEERKNIFDSVAKAQVKACDSVIENLGGIANICDRAISRLDKASEILKENPLKKEA